MCQGTTESSQVHLNAQLTTGGSPDHPQQLDQQQDPFAIMIAQCGLIDTLLHKSTLEQDDDSLFLSSMPKFEQTSAPQCSPSSSTPTAPSSAPSPPPSPPSTPRSPSSNSLAERIHELYGKPHRRRINKGGTLNELFDCAAEALARRSEKSTHSSPLITPENLYAPENLIADSWGRLEKQRTICWIDVHRMVKELTEQLEELRVAPNKQEYKKLLLKWHPDKFTQNYRGKVRKGEEDRVMEKVTKTFQMLMNARPTCEAA